MSDHQWKSETLGKLAAALAKAQGEFAPITRSREVKAGQYSFTYAPLDEVLESTRAALVSNGLALTQLLAGDNLVTTLIHSSSEWVSSSVSILPIPVKIQELGSRLTYLRRYSVAAILGVAPEEDDDGGPSGNADYRTVPRTAAPQQKPRPKGNRPTVEQPVIPAEAYTEGEPVPGVEVSSGEGAPQELLDILARFAAAKTLPELNVVAVDAGTLEESLRADARKAYLARKAELK